MAITIRRSQQITAADPVGRELAAGPRGLRKQADVVSRQASILSAQAAVLRDRAAPVSAWAAPRIADARTRGRAGLDTAYERGVGAAAPRVEQAASTLAPKVGATRDRIVDDLLPRLVTVVNAATAAAAAKAATATDVVADRSTTSLRTVHSASLRAQGKPEPKAARGVGRILVLVGAIGAAGATGYTVWKSQRPASDPWVPATATKTSAPSSGPDRLSSPGQGDSLGSGGVASQSTDVTPPAPDGKTAPPDLTGDTKPAASSTPPTTVTGGTSTAATGTGSATTGTAGTSASTGTTGSTDALTTGTGTTGAAGPAASQGTTTTPVATTASGTATPAPPVVDAPTTGSTEPDVKPGATKPGTAKSPRKPSTGGTTSGS